MSIVNAFVNQIGREVARDVYQGAKASAKKSRPSGSLSVIDNKAIMYAIQNFQLSPYDKVSFRNLEVLNTKIQLVNPRTFDWKECHVAYDGLLDSLAISLDSKYSASIKEFDLQNYSRYTINKQKHVDYIYDCKKVYEERIKKYENKNHTVQIFLFTVLFSLLFMGIATIVLPINIKFLYLVFPAIVVTLLAQMGEKETHKKNMKSVVDLEEYVALI